MLETILHVPHAREHDEREKCREDRDTVHPKTHRHPDAGGDPKACGGRYTVERIAAKYDEPASQKADAHDDSRRDAHRIEGENPEIGDIDKASCNNEEAGAQAHESEGARASGLFWGNSTLRADDAAEDHRKEKLAEDDDVRIKKTLGCRHLISISYLVSGISYRVN